MIGRLRQLQDLVLSVGESPPPNTLDPFLSRLQKALRGLRQNYEATGPSDLAGLLRQGVLRSHLAHGDAPQLRVPRDDAWPDESTWRLFGCTVSRVGPHHLLIEPQRWSPAWLDPHAPSVIDAALAEVPRRQAEPVPADPRLTELTGHLVYASRGQREAVRAAFLMAEGGTLVVSLPTGAGKTTIFQLAALAWAPQGSFSLVVVPTVALAREQEERFRILTARLNGGHAAAQPFAYHSGLSQDDKRAIRDGVRSGTLPILFTSPESALGALRRPLFEAAREGRLRYFVVDEAHIVSHWGQNFRPEFQSIAGLRTALLAVCPTGLRFRTLLLTATLTDESHRTLRSLFGGEDCQIVSAVSLRPEPGFLLHVASAEEDRYRKAFEAIRHLPRPIIVYATLRDDAWMWFERLCQAGFRRVSLVRGGDLSDSEGEQLLRSWRERETDIIVATSAFGLGVDQSDVRSIIHACLPETIDRYYQEVGRGGRDGNASVALLITTPTDLKKVHGLAEETIIGIERGFERWTEMWLRRRHDDDGTAIVSLDAKPADIGVLSGRNAAWNLRTLVLMSQAGLIEFAAHRPPVIERQEGEDEAVFEERRRQTVESFSREVAIRVRDSRHSESEHWNDVVLRTREAIRDADRRSYRMLEELHDLRRPINDLFREIYTLSDPFLVRPPQLMGSCPVTRAEGTVSFKSVDPEVTTLARIGASIGLTLERALSVCRDESGRCWVAYDAPGSGDPRTVRRWLDGILSLLRHAVTHGVVELSLPERFFPEDEWYRLLPRAPLQFLIRATAEACRGETSAAEMPCPRLTLVDEQNCRPEVLTHVMQLPRPRHIIVLPRLVPDPRRSTRRLFDVVRYVELDSLLARLES